MKIRRISGRRERRVCRERRLFLGRERREAKGFLAVIEEERRRVQTL
jgi:hypothetical protein